MILGAGYDTRAYRLPGLAKFSVFEVDFPSIQVDKQKTRWLEDVGNLCYQIRYLKAMARQESILEAERIAHVSVR